MADLTFGSPGPLGYHIHFDAGFYTPPQHGSGLTTRPPIFFEDDFWESGETILANLTLAVSGTFLGSPFANLKVTNFKKIGKFPIGGVGDIDWIAAGRPKNFLSSSGQLPTFNGRIAFTSGMSINGGTITGKVPKAPSAYNLINLKQGGLLSPDGINQGNLIFPNSGEITLADKWIDTPESAGRKGFILRNWAAAISETAL